jgi:hypothetical protein
MVAFLVDLFGLCGLSVEQFPLRPEHHANVLFYVAQMFDLIACYT